MNPGSKEAKEAGCTCPVLDNAHGAGIPFPRKDGLDPVENPSFWVSRECPIHTGLLEWEREPPSPEEVTQ